MFDSQIALYSIHRTCLIYSWIKTRNWVKWINWVRSYSITRTKARLYFWILFITGRWNVPGSTNQRWTFRLCWVYPYLEAWCKRFRGPVEDWVSFLLTHIIPKNNFLWYWILILCCRLKIFLNWSCIRNVLNFPLYLIFFIEFFSFSIYLIYYYLI